MAEATANAARFGVERMVSNQTVARICELRDGGLPWEKVAAQLDAVEVPTPNGGTQRYGANASRLYRSSESAA